MTVFFLVLSCAAQEHWSCGSADAASAYLQAGGIERLLLLMMPERQPPPEYEPGEVRVARQRRPLLVSTLPRPTCGQISGP